MTYAKWCSLHLVWSPKQVIIKNLIIWKQILILVVNAIMGYFALLEKIQIILI